MLHEPIIHMNAITSVVSDRSSAGNSSGDIVAFPVTTPLGKMGVGRGGHGSERDERFYTGKSQLESISLDYRADIQSRDFGLHV